MKISRASTLAAIATLAGLPAAAQSPSILDEIVVTATAPAPTQAASAGDVSGVELRSRPVLRRGEILEAVPGVVVTQHAGAGKANQYFLRGFNLDHGTDFSVSLGGMPLNHRTHAHGQGYTDLNMLVPEFLAGVDYTKGTYSARQGDLSTAGSANFRLADAFTNGFARFEMGEHNHYRAVFGHTFQLGSPGDGKRATGHVPQLSIGAEYSYYDGPWALPENYNRWNGMARYFVGDSENHFAFTLLGYHGSWQSTDQIPSRAVEDGRIDRFGNVDPSNGGDSQRYSAQAEWVHTDGNARTKAQLYAVYYDLNLFSNFTYFLDDPVRGDQFEQSERRWVLGGDISREWSELSVFGKDASFTLGLQTRTDLIDGIGLYKTEQRNRHTTVRVDDVVESSAGIFAESTVKWTPWFRTIAGVRADLFYFDVSSSNGANSGDELEGIVSPKLSLIFGPWSGTEVYANIGTGFHSNDARGVNNRVDPLSGDPLDPVDPLVRTMGAELGVRSRIGENFSTSLALWYLESDSELVYIGDAGTNEAGPGSRRYGVEWTAAWKPANWLSLDVEAAVTNARFRNSPGAEHVPDSVPWMVNAGMTVGAQGDEPGVFGTLRARAFGRRPLVEDNTVKGRETFTVNASLGYRTARWEAVLECLNLLDRNDNDIEYFYTSRLRGEPLGGFDDVHFHPAEPRMFRGRFTYRW